MASQNTIKVVARFRPQNKQETSSGGEQIVDFTADDTCDVQARDAGGSFTFDRVFDTSSRQTDVFDFSIRSTVDDILNGYNGTVFAYGQTGAGKSYTMMGSDIDDEDGKGIMPRIVEQIFASILASPSNIEYTVRVSYMEIYMEKIRDLLAPQNDNLPVHEEKSRGVYVKGLLEIYVSSVQEVYEVMRRGGLARVVAATNMNEMSSRSHSIFVVTVTQKNVETGSAKSGQLFLVDLAGSEKVGKTGASGQTLEEAKKINKSLSALGMVINSLTDGKSTHIPYRDSKLTRILQESLGGNSRTTLIINCSPSSFNDQETISTLRFGVRAKAIKNKAKINAELSPTELKSLLKKAQSQATTFENYITALEGEVQLWRVGESVPKERWASSGQDAASANGKSEVRSPRSRTPLRLQESRRPDTPSRPDSGADSRAESRADADRTSTSSYILDKDEREEFLKRENELQDQLAEKESQLADAERRLKTIREELSVLKERDPRLSKENESLTGQNDELRMQFEKINFESKEDRITIDGLKEANAELTSELDEVKQQLLDAKISAKETTAVLDEKEKKKAERMAEMMAGFDLQGEGLSDNERKVRKAIEQVDSLYEISVAGEAVPPGELQELRSRLIDTQDALRQSEKMDAETHGDEAQPARKVLEEKLACTQKEYQGLLESKLEAGDIEDIKLRLGNAYSAQQKMNGLNGEQSNGAAESSEENLKLRAEIENLQTKLKNGPSNADSNLSDVAGRTLQQQIAEFDAMKKSLMRDLQNRCERVVELEISLDETREQYNNVLRTSNNKAQQKKMAFLERNLEQLTVVQRQLVEQNSSLKKEVAIAERKLVARNERIQSLESLLKDSQEKLTAANHRFETQLSAVKERLEAAKAGSTRGLGSADAGTGFAFGGAVSRIAKPLRGGGGGGGASDAPTVPTLSSLQQQEVGGGKRSSWFFRG